MPVETCRKVYEIRVGDPGTGVYAVQPVAATLLRRHPTLLTGYIEALRADIVNFRGVSIAHCQWEANAYWADVRDAELRLGEEWP